MAGGAPLATDVRPVSAELYLIPVRTRVPLKFGPETLTHVTCARVRLEVSDRRGRRAVGWGETPLSVQWVWPSALSYEERHAAGLLATELEAAGLTVERGAGGVETALRARTGKAGGARVAILAEYDALPEIGHACGHNLIAGAALGSCHGEGKAGME